MAKIIESKHIFLDGVNIELIAGNEISDNSPIVAKFPELFEGSAKAPKVKKATKVKKVEEVEEVVITEEVQAPVEEILIEEPVAELEVTEEVVEVEEETKPKRRRRKN
jgi:hypothetical protein